MKLCLSSEHFHSNYSQLQLCFIKFCVIETSFFFHFYLVLFVKLIWKALGFPLKL